MKKWLIVHSLESFKQNSRMIGFAAKTAPDGSPILDNDGNPIPALGRVSEIRPGDRIIYYGKGDSVIKGIYEIVQSHYARETQWPDSPFQFETKPIVELEEPYDFKLLLPSLDLFKHLSELRKWGSSLMGITNAIKPLPEHDYELIENALIEAQEQIGKEKVIIGEEFLDEKTQQSYHNRIREMLYEIGQMERKVSEKEYRIDGERIDVVWKRIEKGNPYAVFEVQIGGNFYQALAKLKHAWDKWNSHPFLVTTRQYRERALEWVSGSFHEIQGELRVVDCEKVKDLYEAIKRIKGIKEELGID